MKISVIIPAYNCASYIAQTLNCIYAQNFPKRDIETIVCLDAPTDDTAAVVRAWARAHRGAKIKIIENKTNMGVSKTRNQAICAATGDFIHFMDSDDFINTDFYSALYNAAMGAGADVAVSSYVHQRRPDSSVVLEHEIVVSNPQDKIDFTRVDQHGMMWRYLIRRAFWNKNKFSFPADMRFCEDWVLANRMVYAANSIVLVPRAMYLYQYRDNSLMTLVDKTRESTADAIRANADMQKFLSDNGLRHCVKPQKVWDHRLFGRVRLFTVTSFDNRIEYRLFGRFLMMARVRNYKMFRKQ